MPEKWDKNPSVPSRVLVNGRACHHLRSVGVASRPELIPMCSYYVMLAGNIILDGVISGFIFKEMNRESVMCK